jgi:hypothetical protein
MGGDEVMKARYLGDNLPDDMQRFRTLYPSSDSEQITNSKKKGEKGDNKKKSDANVENSKSQVKKTVYVTNSHSAELSGGDIMLRKAMSMLDAQLDPGRQYIPDEFAVTRMSIDRPFLAVTGHSIIMLSGRATAVTLTFSIMVHTLKVHTTRPRSRKN